MPAFPSIEFVEDLKEHCNNHEPFRKATEWADVNVVLDFGGERYWLKLYRGQIIDLMEYKPANNNAFGYDVIVSGDVAAWNELMEGSAKSWGLLTTGKISIDGNLMQGNLIHEALCILMEAVQYIPEEVSNVA